MFVYLYFAANDDVNYGNITNCRFQLYVSISSLVPAIGLVK